MECYDFTTSNQHRQLLPLVIIAMIVYVLGIPVLFATLLFGRRKVRPSAACTSPDVCPTSARVMLSGLRLGQKRRHCCVVVIPSPPPPPFPRLQILRHRQGLERMLHEKAMAEAKTKKKPMKTAFSTMASMQVDAKSEVLTKLNMDEPKRQLQQCMDLYGFLFKHYEEQQFWWEVLVLVRKVAFCLIVNLPKAPEQQTLLGIICLLPYIALVNGQRPYSTPYLNVMDLLGASAATAIALAGLVMFGGYDTTLTSDETSTIQIVLIILLVTFLVGFVIYDAIPKVALFLRLYRQRKRLKRLRRQASPAPIPLAVSVLIGRDISTIRLPAIDTACMSLH